MEDGGAVEVFDEAGADDVGLDAGSAEEAGADVDGAQAASSKHSRIMEISFFIVGSVLSLSHKISIFPLLYNIFRPKMLRI